MLSVQSGRVSSSTELNAIVRMPKHSQRQMMQYASPDKDVMPNNVKQQLRTVYVDMNKHLKKIIHRHKAMGSSNAQLDKQGLSQFFSLLRTNGSTEDAIAIATHRALNLLEHRESHARMLCIDYSFVQ
ncbi:hypothetical protein F2P81_002224 [Scophthalmus maximus]|uniref:Uncharacterized protein n=1 Tax=Scophthalmus maximus TaxID=52904 RepID=A0A6A4TKF3_SCOMX|nr:hypothetical protein F2P81_002224 [Scophthalmus maximus]